LVTSKIKNNNRPRIRKGPRQKHGRNKKLKKENLRLGNKKTLKIRTRKANRSENLKERKR
jgi:hypothetical protein